MVGVSLCEKKGGKTSRLCWEANMMVNGTRFRKSFQISVYGYLEAYDLAVKAREEFERIHDLTRGII